MTPEKEFGCKINFSQMIELLYFISFVLIVAVTVQVAGVYELVLILRGGGERDITVTEDQGRGNAIGLLIYGLAFFSFYAWLYVNYSEFLLPEAASVHGLEIDKLMSFNFAMINIVFFITISLLFYFPIKYFYRKGRSALWYPENHKAELVLTIIPTIAMMFVIVWGLRTWNNIFSEPAENALKIELYAKQFDWTARYAGNDNQLGDFNYRLIGGMNTLGLKADDAKVQDDVLVKGEFHIVKDRAVAFSFRSQEVIHSAYMPHFRAQMNCVPGMTTRFNFVPNKTTAEMREITGDPEFNYILLCNKICGVAHYNMQMTIVVESQEEYDAWMAEQKTVEAQGIFADIESDNKAIAEEGLLASGK